ncbi:uncharacterized protein LOC132301279 isoform X1 [Cornus florida]|uniref:uncharacterized protein LOC132301279 isoform X1 n=1 Tax=Cornus florida TaxID=4283 RepID=UPI00289C979C|nr:uncharacterized protein LOC132301279 isoform X1 [Cornus florida]XP_059654536.1 uncharacterized protein LOC132301279 isoform X1 [Cornus florida]
MWNGFIQTYTTWIYHGEQLPSSSRHDDGHTLYEPIDSNVNNDDMHELLYEGFGIQNEMGEQADRENEYHQGPNEEADKFYKLLDDGKTDIYLGCKNFTKLSFTVKLYLLKTLHHWTDKSFSKLLMFLKDVLPEGETLPKSFYETKKIISNLGLKYDKIDACPFDCMLYWKEHANDETCHKCGKSRWKDFDTHSEGSTSTSPPSKKTKIPAKVIRYFPLKSRLQRLFMSNKKASDMRWHEEERIKDGKLRHPADSLVWDHFDKKYPEFARDSRNVRLGLASDCFNPFRTMSIAHSTWPVVLAVYNLPGWMCMKQPFFILSTLIPGPKGPGNDIDVYLQPLIEELKELWVEGVDTYDTSRKGMFRMHAALLWTISDFPAFANLSGWSTKGYLAYPVCLKETCSCRLKHSKKICYTGHRHFAEQYHRFRRNKASFDGTEETRCAPPMLSGTEVLHELEGISFPAFGKGDDGKGNAAQVDEMDENPMFNWRKKSIFFELPYWEHLLIRHNLDVMHIEKNICDNVLYTLMNEPGRGNDGLKSRLDLQEMQIKHSLHPQERGANKYYLPSASYTFSPLEKKIFCQALKKVKVPDGYAANISRCVKLKERKISGLKSHDSHILMQQLLPVSIRKLLPKNVCFTLVELSNFYKEFCSKTLIPAELDNLQNKIALTLCKLEMIFLPSFFDVMVHLSIHLAQEAKIAIPVQYRWMCPFERFTFFALFS